MECKHISAIVARRKSTPGAANDVLKKLRILLRFAIDNGMRKDDPTLRVKSFAEGTFHTWTDGEISAFEDRWPIGTRERTAFALFLYTGQRLADVRRMSWRDVEGSTIKVIQGKTKAELWIPLHPDLSAALAAWPRTHMVMLTTHYSEPHSVKGLGNWMAATIAQAGLPDRCVTHGLRKAAARRLAEAGCTAHQIMSITGHQSMKESRALHKGCRTETPGVWPRSNNRYGPRTNCSNPKPKVGTNADSFNLFRRTLAGWRPVGSSNPLGPPTEAIEKNGCFLSSL
jgi:integrase